MSKNELTILELGNEDMILELDSCVVTWSEINGNPESNKKLIALLTKLLAEKVDKNEDIIAGTHTKITYDEKGLVVAGEELSIEDLPELKLENIVDVVATADEVNKLHGLKATKEELDVLHGITATTEELNKLHGLKASTEELNKLKGLLISAVEMNMLAGIRSNVQTQLDSKQDKLEYGAEDVANKTDNYNVDSSVTYPSSKALKDGLGTKQDRLTDEQLARLDVEITREELDYLINNKLDKNEPISAGKHTKISYDEDGLVLGGEELTEADIPTIHLKKVNDVITTAAELNQLKGIKVEAEQLNTLKDIEGNVQEQLDEITELLPDEVSVDNKLADKEYVKTYLYDHAGFFLSKDANNTPFLNMAELLNTHTFYDNGKIKRISEHDYTVIMSDETHNSTVSLYAWIRDDIYNEGHWVYQYKISNSYDDLTFNWGNIIGNINDQHDLINKFNATLKSATDYTDKREVEINKEIAKKQPTITDLDEIRSNANAGKTAKDTIDGYGDIVTHNANEFETKINDLATIRSNASAGKTAKDTIDGYGNIVTHDAVEFQTSISDLSTIRSNASAGKSASDTISGYGNIVTHNASEFEPALGFTPYNATNPDGFQNATQVSTAITQAIAQIPQFQLKIVETLPETGEKMVLYFVPKEGAGDDVYNEYIWLDTVEKFELVGSTTIDLTDYVKNTDYPVMNDTAGVIKVSSSYATNVNSSGFLTAQNKTAEQYENLSGNAFISKNTLDNIQETYVTEVGDTKYQPILTAGNGIDITNNKVGLTTEYIIDESMFDVTVTKTYGVPPYSTSYYYTNITIHDDLGIEWIEGASYYFLIKDTVISSSYRNVRFRIGATNEDGTDNTDWKPLLSRAGVIVNGTIYVNINYNIPFQYRTNYQENGALQVMENNTTYIGMSQSEIDAGTSTTNRLISPKLLITKIDEKLEDKQDVIDDLDTIRDGASKGATALQSYTETDPTVPNHVKSITSDDITNWNNKQSAISDLDTIRSGASAGATALQSVPDTYALKTYVDNHHDSSKQDTIDDLDEIRTNAKAGVPTYDETTETITFGGN